MSRSVLSLFSGVGGFDLGLERTGWTVTAQAESDPKASSVLRRHWPDVQLFDDVRNVTKETLDVQPELICGGFPCQDISHAGKRAGLAGERSGLWWEFYRIICETLPRWVLIENVTGLLSSGKPKGDDLEAILRALAEVGYVGEWRVVDSRHLGVPQRRRRVFLVGHLGDRRGRPVLLEQDRGPRHPQAGDQARSQAAARAAARTDRRGEAGTRGGLIAEEGVVASLTTGLASGGPDLAHAQAEWLVPAPHLDRTGTVTASFAKGAGQTQIDNGILVPVIPFDPTQITHRENRSRPMPGDPSPTLAAQGKPPAIVGALTYSITPESGQGALLRATPTDVANTLTAADASIHDRGLRIVSYAGVRRLTPRECERLQGFPDDWTLLDADGELLADTHRYRFMGNAVTVPFIEWIGRRIRMAAASDRATIQKLEGLVAV